MRLIAGKSSLDLAKGISTFLDVPIASAEFKSFSDEETVVEIKVQAESADFIALKTYSLCSQLHGLQIHQSWNYSFVLMH